ncbi:hypothetical protein [Pseudomonas viridiflava]|uniref:hypothetical protein n=1 Tax=Pseudomonas viridiflava TaxID=33069 RepID=UPI001F13CCE8|nr:hypothetical protein [Pseudomonas viridiflava]
MSVSVENISKNRTAESNSQSQWSNSVDRAKAKDVGIEWELPGDDKRSAQEIIDASPVLKNLGNQSGVKDKLKERVGDFEHDRDAAYRAVQVLDHVELLNEDGVRIVNGNDGNGRVDGFTKGGDAKHGTEAGRLQDFGKYGWENLKGELKHVDSAGDSSAAREQAEAAGIHWVRPEGDTRSAQDIIDDNPLLKNLGNQSGVKDMLKEQVGDFENDPDAAFRAGQVMDRVVGYDEGGKPLTGKDVADTRINGFTKGGEAKHGTEAGRLQDFGKYGFSSLPKAQASQDIAGYKTYVETNKNADEGSKQIAQYTAILSRCTTRSVARPVPTAP